MSKSYPMSNPSAGAGPPCDIPAKIVGGLIATAKAALSGSTAKGAGSTKDDG